jgi:DNA uptake protein ComE-like DNA-binding protein
LQETGFPVSSFRHVSVRWFTPPSPKEENRLVRIQLLFGFLAATLICALIPGNAGFALQSARSQASSQNPPPPEARTDINAASLDELLKVPGMTRTWAARIIRYRPYRGKNDLVDRGVVTSQVYDRIKDYIIAHRAKS